MSINDLTIGEAKELSRMFGGGNSVAHGLDSFAIGRQVIVRTYSAGVFFGVLKEKSGNEVILAGARRMWRWCCASGISLSSVAMQGINQKKSRIAEPVESVWLEAIEIIPCSDAASKSISGADYATAE